MLSVPEIITVLFSKNKYQVFISSTLHTRSILRFCSASTASDSRYEVYWEHLSTWKRFCLVVSFAVRTSRKYIQQLLPWYKSAQDKSMRDLRRVKLASPACTKRYAMPATYSTTTDTRNVWLGALYVLSCRAALLNRSTHCCIWFHVFYWSVKFKFPRGIFFSLAIFHFLGTHVMCCLLRLEGPFCRSFFWCYYLVFLYYFGLCFPCNIFPFLVLSCKLPGILICA